MMDMLTLYGLASVLAMLLSYALEERATIFTALFAAACLAASIYGFLSGAWPFGLVEAVWALVALAKWRRRASGRG